MIKTHKPRGQFWTCASVFQQSLEIRNINFEDCTPPQVETFGTDSEDELLPSERAAKRRRIEQLATGFLNGEPLLISSARAHMASSKTALEWNERSRLSAKWSLPVVEMPEDDAELWIDAEDSWHVPVEPRSKRKTRGKAKSAQLPRQSRNASSNAETVTEVEAARSGCKPVKYLRAPKVSLEPSTEAMKQAAALRARRLERAATQAPRLPQGLVLQATPEKIRVEPRSEPATLALPRYFRTRKPPSTEWLLRQHTKMYELAPDESIDELSRSRVETPSRTQHGADQQTSFHLVTGSADAEFEPPSSGTVVDEREAGHLHTVDKVATHNGGLDQVFVSSADPLSLSFSQKMSAAAQVSASESVANGSYHTALEDTHGEQHHMRAESQHDAQEDSQTQLLRRQGINAAPRKSWASMNEPLPSASNKPAAYTADGEMQMSSAASSIRQSLQESAQHAGKPMKGRRAKSGGSNKPLVEGPATRRRSAPTEFQNAEEHMASLPVDQQRHMGAFKVPVEMQTYTELQPAQQGESPFMFRRKRVSKADDGDRNTKATVGPEKKGRRRVAFPSSEDVVRPASEGPKKDQAEQVAACPPVLDMPLGHDSSFGLRLNMALVDEHLNAVLPSDLGSGRRSSAVKRALRQELLDSGAEISRIEGEPASSQVVTHGSQAIAAHDQGSEIGSHAEEGLKQARQLSRQGLAEAANKANASLETEARQSLRDAVQQARRESLSGYDRFADEQHLAHTQWPGTQVALYQAQRDLIASPEKPAAGRDSHMDDTPKSVKRTPVVSTDLAARPPLRELSQEQMPGTQALMQGWSPWSNFKKPEGRAAHAAVESPTMRATSTARRSRSSRTSDTADDPVTVLDDSTRRRSSLRFSTTTSSSPLASSRLHYPILKRPSMGSNEKSASSSDASTAKSILKTPALHGGPTHNNDSATWAPTTVASFEAIQLGDSTGFSTGPPIQSYYEAGQGHLLREDSDIDRTITELTADVLSTNDMNGIMSQ